MRLKEKKLKLWNKKNNFLKLLLFSYLFFQTLISLAQTNPFISEKTSLADALTKTANFFNIKIVFDSDQLKKLKIATTISEENAEKTIEAILKNSGFTFQYKHETFLIVKQNPQNEKQLLVSGKILDIETGEYLPYASIFVKNNNRNLVSNVEGNFTCYIHPEEKLHLQVRYLGYSTLDTVINSKVNYSTLFFGLKQKHQSIETVEIKSEKLEIVSFSEQAGHFAFHPTRFTDLPNYGETDVFRSLQLIPGISIQENSSDLNIRGSSADQNLVILDGFTLYNLDHFFGVFSALNPNVIKNIQVYRGGFGSLYGERVSGIVDITGKSGNENKAQFQGGINLISGNITAEIPITKKLKLLAAFRRAYSDIYSSWLADAILTDKINPGRRIPGGFESTIEPKFYFSDHNIKLTFSPHKNEVFSFSYYAAKDDLNSSNYFEDEETLIDTKDLNEWGNYGLGFLWRKQWSGKFFSNLQGGHSGYFNRYSNQSYFSNTATNSFPPANLNLITNEENNLSDYFISLKNSFYLNNQNTLDFGFTSRLNQYDFYKDASTNFVYSAIENKALLLTTFAQNKFAVNNKFGFIPGFRLNFYNKTQKIYFEPRFSAHYNINKNLLLKFATGIYYQFLNKSSSEQTFGYNRDFWVLSDNETHPVVSSNHFILGANYKYKNLSIDVESYYKSVNGLEEYLFFQNPERGFGNNDPFVIPKPELSNFISGKGKAFGIDFLAKYEKPNFSTWLAYSISKSIRNFEKINFGENIPAPFDQTHELKWTNIYRYKKWNFSSLTLFTTGHPYIQSSSKTDDFSSTRIYNRLPNYFRIDLSANFNFCFKNIFIKPGFSILNALNSENYLDIYTRNINFQNQQVSETTLIKAQDLTLNFFLNFRF